MLELRGMPMDHFLFWPVLFVLRLYEYSLSICKSTSADYNIHASGHILFYCTSMQIPADAENDISPMDFSAERFILSPEHLCRF